MCCVWVSMPFCVLFILLFIPMYYLHRKSFPYKATVNHFGKEFRGGWGDLGGGVRKGVGFPPPGPEVT